MAKKETTPSSSGIEVNTFADSSWAQVADTLPETVTINGNQYNSADLSGNARKLLVIYLADQRIVGQQKEMVALAELGLKSLLDEIERNLPGDWAISLAIRLPFMKVFHIVFCS